MEKHILQHTAEEIDELFQKVDDITVDAETLNLLEGAIANIQEQLNAKASTTYVDDATSKNSKSTIETYFGW